MSILTRPSARQMAIAILLLIAAIVVLSISGRAQSLPQNTPVTLSIGTRGYVTINGQNYTRGSLRSYFRTGDSSLGFLFMPDRTVFVKPMRDTFFYYGDSSNRKVNNFNVLKAWIDSNFEYRGN